MASDGIHHPEIKAGPPYRGAPHWMALFAAMFTLPLLFVGGSVTTYRVGLAVPDWPTTFGMNMFLYDFWNAPFGVKVEHTHRLYGAAVGLATIGMFVGLLALDRRTWMKALGFGALVAVIVQGILGGTRVTEVSTLLAAVHGCMGQAFFGLMVAIVVMTGRDWLASDHPVEDRAGIRAGSWILLLLVYVQIALGSWLRHYGTLPALVVHGIVALVVLAAATRVSWKVLMTPGETRRLRRPAFWLATAVILQVLLGVGALIYLLPFGGVPRPVGLYEAMIRTGHQTNAAILLASTVVLALRAQRQFLPASRSDATGSLLPSVTKSGQAPASLEVVG